VPIDISERSVPAGTRPLARLGGQALLIDDSGVLARIDRPGGGAETLLGTLETWPSDSLAAVSGSLVLLGPDPSVGTAGTLTVLDLRQRRFVELDGGPGTVVESGFSTDRSWVVATGPLEPIIDDFSGTALLGAGRWVTAVWDAETGLLIRRIEGESAASVSWLGPSRVAILEGGGTLRTYDVTVDASATQVNALDVASATGAIITVEPDGNGGVDLVRRQDSTSPPVVARAFDPGDDDIGPIWDDVSVDPLGRRVFFASALVDLDTGASQLIDGHDQSNGAFSPDGSTLALISPSGITLVDASSGLTSEIVVDSAWIANDAIWLRDGRSLIVSASSPVEIGRGALLRVDVVRGGIELLGDGPQPFTLALHPTDDRLAVGDATGVVRLWDVSTATPTVESVLRPNRGALTSLDVSSDGERLLISALKSDDFVGEIWDIGRGVRLEDLGGLPVLDGRPWETARFTSDGSIAVAGLDGIQFLPDAQPDLICPAISERALAAAERITGTTPACWAFTE
jgi:WD40 repeat protein